MVLHAVAIVGVVFLLSWLCAYVGVNLLVPVVALVLVVAFVRNLELGLMCAVLSFFCQTRAWEQPAWGASAAIRFDELFCGCVVVAFALRWVSKKECVDWGWPLVLPLWLYAGAAVFTTLLHAPDISHTPYWFSRGHGLAGLSVVSVKFSVAVGLYLAIATRGHSPAFRTRLLWCLVAAACAAQVVDLGLSSALGRLPYGELYDRYHWIGRFGGIQENFNTSGSYSLQALWVMGFGMIAVRTWRRALCLVPFMALAAYTLLLSGSRGGWLALVAGLAVVGTFLALRQSARMTGLVVGMVAAVVGAAFAYQSWSTPQQRHSLQERSSSALAVVRMEPEAWNVESGRLHHWRRFARAVEREPLLIVAGNGWQRRASHTGIVSLHSDLLTLWADLGVLGLLVFVLFYGRLARAFWPRRGLSRQTWGLCVVFMGCLTSTLIYSFSAELLTVYPTIDTTFVWTMAIMAVAGGFLGTRMQRDWQRRSAMRQGNAVRPSTDGWGS